MTKWLVRLRNAAAAVFVATLLVVLAGGAVLDGQLGVVQSECETTAAAPGLTRCRAHAGVWLQTSAAAGELRLISAGAATLWIDDREVLVRRPDARARAVRARVSLPAGIRRLRVRTETAGQPFQAVWVEEGKDARPIGPLFRHTVTRGKAWAATALVGIRGVLGSILGVWVLLGLAAGMVMGSRAAGAHACGVVLVWASLLGVESIVRRSVDAPPLVASVLAEAATSLRPADWQQGPEAYYGDPPDYLARARRMEGFYDAEAREPVYVALVRGFLFVSGGSPVALGLASGASWDAFLWAVYLVSARVVGVRLALLALTLLAADRELLALSSMGERDQTFAAAFAWSVLACLRAWEQAGTSRALWFGLAAAIAALTRISALSYLVPALGLLALGGAGQRRTRGRTAGVAAALLSILVAPYLLSCAIAFGDPLRSINIHTGYYRDHESKARPAGEDALSYLFAGRSPLERIDTAAGGLMEATFGRPFPGLHVWLGPEAARVAAVVAWVGLLALRGSGRLVFLLTVLAAIPFSLTWNLGGGGDLRFVLFALLATAISGAAGAGLIGSVVANRNGERAAALRTLGFSMAILALLFAARIGLRRARLMADGASGREVFASGHALDVGVVRGFGVGAAPMGDLYLRPSGNEPRLDVRLLAGTPWRLTIRWWSLGPVRVTEGGRVLSTLPATPADAMGLAEIDLPASPQTDRIIRFEGPVSLWWVRFSRPPAP